MRATCLLLGLIAGCGGPSAPPIGVVPAPVPPPSSAPAPVVETGPHGPRAPRKIAAGWDFSCAVRGGRVVCWGKNEHGSLGDGTTDARTGAVMVKGIADAVEITSETWSACALRATGAVVCWGPASHDAAPAPVVGARDVLQIDGTCGVTKAGGALCWSPGADARAVDGVAGAVQVAANDEMGCARTRAGRVSCWKRAKASPATSVSGIGAVVDLVSSRRELWARLEDGALKSISAAGKVAPLEPPEPWPPEDADGNKAAPIVLPKASAFRPGDEYVCILHDSGKATCWGSGNPALDPAERFHPAGPRPTEVALTDVVDLATGQRHACALRTGDVVSCWGANDEEQLAAPAGKHRALAVPVPKIADAKTIAAAHARTCVAKRDGTLACWGENTSARERDIERVATLALGELHACGVLVGGEVACWGGSNGSGERGVPGPAPAPKPVPKLVPKAEKPAQPPRAVRGPRDNPDPHIAREAARRDAVEYASNGLLGSGGGDGTLVTGVSGAKAVAVSDVASCALLARGAVTCWGDTGFDPAVHDAPCALSLMRGSDPNTCAKWKKPALVAGITGATAIVAGSRHFCVLEGAGSVRCWRRGLAKDDTRVAATLVSIPIADVSALRAGGDVTCALRKVGGAVCWTLMGDAFDAPEPAAWLPADAIDFAIGEQVACAVARTGAVTCRDVAVPLATDAIAIAAGAKHACALKKDGTAMCWGANEHAQLGIEPLLHSEKPLAVSLPDR